MKIGNFKLDSTEAQVALAKAMQCASCRYVKRHARICLHCNRNICEDCIDLNPPQY